MNEVACTPQSHRIMNDEFVVKGVRAMILKSHLFTTYNLTIEAGHLIIIIDK